MVSIATLTVTCQVGLFRRLGLGWTDDHNHASIMTRPENKQLQLSSIERYGEKTPSRKAGESSVLAMMMMMMRDGQTIMMSVVDVDTW